MIGKALLAFLAIGVTATVSSAEEPRSSSLTKVDAKYVFAPVGFDDNDESVVLVDGYLPSGCYRLTRAEVKVDEVAKTISIVPMARYFDVPCVEALVPFHFDVKFGILAHGDYTLTVNEGDNVLTETLKVGESRTAGPDDFLYAPVDEVTVSTDPDTGRMTAVLQGRFTRACMDWEDVRVENNGKTINILPIMTMSNPDTCNEGERSFKRIVDLPADITPGRHMLHVRSLNGQAVNYVFFRSARR